jgi:gamma-glutamyltranspeptidase/glutathione hydrolase
MTSRLRIVVAVALLLAPCAAGARQAVGGRHGAVAAEHRLASLAGVELLRAGGNAVDAAAAAILASGVVNPSSSGIGGGGFLVVYRAADARAHTVDFREAAPLIASRDLFVRDGRVDAAASKRGGLAVGTPGEIAGLALALSRFGTKSLAEVAAPAIRIARDGFVVEEHLARVIAALREPIAADPGLAAVFLHADGTPVHAGETLRRPALARTLEIVGERGPGAFYEGEIAADVLTAVRAHGGLLSSEDLKAYKAIERPPIVTAYGRWKVVGVAPPSSGGGVIGEALNVLAPYRPSALGRDSATYLHVLAESLKAAFADRAQWYGDPGFVEVPIERLLSPAHAADLRSRISAVKAAPPDAFGTALQAADAGTAHVSVVDAAGNAVAATSSVNTPFGALVSVPGRDIVLNNTMDDFSAQPGVPNAYGLVGSEANAVAPGKRPLSSMSPTIVLDGQGAVRLVVGASGGPRIISATLQVLLNVLEFSMDVGPAVKAPRIHHQWRPAVLAVEAGVPQTVRDSLVRRGHDVESLSHGAAVSAVEVVGDRRGRLVRAASDARKGGRAAAY